MEIPKNIAELAEKNDVLLARMGFVPGRDNPLELCNEVSYRQTGLFSDEAINLTFSEGALERSRTYASPVVARNIGMILIRADMMHASAEFERFIAERFTILHTQDVQMDPATYWNIYQHDFYRPSTMHSRLTRAAIYIGSACRLVVFQGSETDPAVATPDYVRGSLKGEQGVYRPETLRGDLVYRNAVALQMHRLDDPDVDERIKLAADPFAIYRALARSGQEFPPRPFAYPLLYLTGVGVHIPDSSEIGNDLSQFVDVALTPHVQP